MAKADLLEIGRYIAEKSQSIEVALRFYDSVDSRLKLLAENPEMGELRPELAPEVRAFTVGNYVMFFRPAGKGIELLRVLHSARDIPRVFRNGK